MTRSELENFVQKFQQLRQAGYTAHLDVDTHAGQSWVALRVMLGPIKYTQKKPQQRHRSPSYLRRQERRKAARLAAEVPSNKNDNETEKVSESIQTEEVSDVAVDCNKDNTEAEEVKLLSLIARFVISHSSRSSSNQRSKETANQRCLLITISENGQETNRQTNKIQIKKYK